MYFNVEWLSEWLRLAEKPDVEGLSERLTMAGLEVESVTPCATHTSNVVTARITDIAPHPEADRLKLCTVDSGDGEMHQIVCGAPNVYRGMYVPFARVGAKLGDVEIHAAEIRGVESKGMLCSATELGLGDDHAGLLDLGEVALGLELHECLPTEDNIYKLDLTPNRGDCLSIRGIAREVAALYQCDLNKPPVASVEQKHDEHQAVKVEQHKACPVYMARVITELDCRTVLPLWMRERLRRCNVRSVHPIVDALNYVMLEYGQPMHAFDRSKIKGTLVVRYAKAGEKMVALGGTELCLREADLVISDDDKVHALAGVVGAEYSAVTEQTEAVVLECAFFDPRTIVSCVRTHNIHTEASHRFERGVDFNIQEQAMERASALICELVGGNAGAVVSIRDDKALPTVPVIPLSLDRLNRRLGVSIDEAYVEQSLRMLGCDIEPQDDRTWQCTVPSWRFDLSIEDDLMEEVGRMYGYDNVPDVFEVSLSSFPSRDARDTHYSELRACLTASGYHEAVAYSFVGEAMHKMFYDGEAVPIENPISEEMSQMCGTLLPNLVQALSHNLRRQFERVRLFQMGRVFAKDHGEMTESVSLAGVACGSVTAEQWGGDKAVSDFYSMKGDVERLLCSFDNVRFVQSTHKALHPWQCADVLLGDTVVGYLGQLSPQIAKRCKINTPAMMFELNLSRIPLLAVHQYEPISPYPSIRCDLAVTIEKDKPVADLVACIWQTQLKMLRKVIIFDIFTGGNIQSGYKSVGVGLIFQDLHDTLRKEDSDSLVEEIVEAIHRFGGSIREK